MADSTQTANVVLTANNSQYDQSMQQSSKYTQTLLASVVALSNGMNSLASKAGKKIQLIGLAEVGMITAATAAAAKFDQQMSVLKANATLTGRSYEQMTKQVNSLRREFGVTADQAVALQQQLRQMGQTSGIDKMTQSMMKLSAVTGESLGSLTQGMVTLQRQMGTQGAASTERFASALANVSAKAGVSASAVLDFSNSIAPVAKVAGISQKEVMGFSTAFVKAGQEGQYAATAFSKMLTDITRSVQTGSPELKAYSNLIGVSVEQFKEMPRAEAVTRIFEEITKQGPDAIKTLERFGLDGIRTYKALQATAQQGGIRQAFKDVNDGYSDTKKFTDAAHEAMNSVNEQLSKMAENLKIAGEAFGKAFLPPLKIALQAINGILGPLGSMLQSLGNVPGIALAAGAAMALMAGTVVRSYGAMVGLAAVRMLGGGTFAAGLMSARASAAGLRAPGFARRAAATYETGAGGVMQRWMFRRGAGIGTALGENRARRMAGVPRPSMISRAGALATRGLGAFARMQLEPAYWSNVRNPFNQQPMFQEKTAKEWMSNTKNAVKEGTAQAFRPLFGPGQAPAATGLGFTKPGADPNVGPAGSWKAFFNTQNKAMKDAFEKLKGAPSAARDAREAKAAAAAAGGMEGVAKESVKIQGFWKTLGTETVKLSAAMAKAAAGSVAMVGGPVAGGALKGAGKLAGSALGFMGGPWGLALMAGMAGFSAYSSYKEGRKEAQDAAKEGDATLAAGGAYRVALGEAARATTTFAEIVKHNATALTPKGQEGTITAETQKAASRPNFKFTDPNIEAMKSSDVQQAIAYVSAMGQMSPADRQLLGVDLTKRFGAVKAQQIMDAQAAAQATGTIQYGGGLLSGINASGAGFLWTKPTEESKRRTSVASQTFQASNADVFAKYGERGVQQNAAAQINAISQQIAQGGDVDRDAMWGIYAASMSINPDDKKAKEDFMRLVGTRQAVPIQGAAAASFTMPGGALNQGAAGKFNATPNMAPTMGGGAVASKPATISSMASFIQAHPDMFKNSPVADQILGLAAAGIDTETTSFVGAGMNVPPRTFTTINDYMLDALRQSKVGSQVFAEGGRIGGVINQALTNTEDVNAQARAMKDLANTTMDITGSFNDAINSLNQMQAAIGDVNDPLYQMAANAKAFIASLQQFESHFMTRAQVFTQGTQALGQAITFAQGHPGAPEAESNLAQQAQAVQQLYTQGYDQFRQLYQAYKDLDFQQAQAMDSYYRNKKRAEEEFQRMRQRADDAFARQEARQIRDYNRQRTYAQQDFDKQRRYAEEDFAHQQQLYLEAAAKNIYNIYERIQTMRSWDAQNLLVNMQDQLDQMNQQATNLEQLRKMGISSDVIKQLGLDKPENAQQLARFVTDLMNDPTLVKAFNDAAVARQKAATKIVTDVDNTEWTEMQRGFKLNSDRALDAFNENRSRQELAFKTGLADSRSEYKIQTQQQADDMALQLKNMLSDMKFQFGQAEKSISHSAEDMTTDIATMQDEVIRRSGGVAKTQLTTLQTNMNTASKLLKTSSKTLVADIKAIYADVAPGAAGGGSGHAGSTSAAESPGAQNPGATPGTYSGKGAVAAGGLIEGHSTNGKQDDVPYWLTSGEYVHQTDAVQYYGKGFMDAINKRQIPRAALGMAEGGIVGLGHKLQDMGYQVGEHPLFGGVHPVHTPGSWHYRAGAIDVNHDQGGEKAALNAIIQLARSYGMRVIWQVAGHFDHAHFDIGKGADMIGPGVPSGSRGQVQQDADALLAKIKKLQSVKAFEKARVSADYLPKILPKDTLANKILEYFMSIGGTGGMGDDLGPIDTHAKAGTPAANRALGKAMAAQRGWSGAQWNALDWIFQHESGWNQFADNPSSDAYGIPQSLPGSKMASSGSDWRTNPRTQIDWGLKYIKGRYKDPVSAQKWWKNHNWYGNGAIFKEAAMLGERGHELVLPLNQAGVEYLLAVMRQFAPEEARAATGSSRGTPVNGSTYVINQHVDKSFHVDGPVTVQSQDPRDMLRKIEAEKRTAALVRPRS